MKDSKLNNLLGLENFSEKEFLKKNPPTKRTDVAKDVLKENAYVVGKDVNEKPKSKEEHNFKQLHNLISLDDFNQKVPETSAKPTKRTDVAKDVIKENAYVVGKDINEKPKSKEEVKLKDLNNLLSFDDFSKDVPDTSTKSTKRTDVAKDVILEKKKKDKEEDCDDKESKKKKDDDCDDDEKPKKGLSAAQKKLPEALQKAILKRQGK